MKAASAYLMGLVLFAAVSGISQDRVELVDPFEVWVSNPAPLTKRSLLKVVLYDNGPLVNCPGCGAGGADESQVQTFLGMNTIGFSTQFSLGYSVADDFAVTDAAGWEIDNITFFAYQTGSSTISTITGVYVQIWDGDPSAGGTIVWGDLTTNRLLTTGWSNIYRVIDTASGDTNRPIMDIVATVGTTLAQGTYWVQWSTDGTLTSGPYAPPITINGQTTTGNALQFRTSWHAMLDSGSSTPQGLPFIIDGSVGPVDFGPLYAVDDDTDSLYSVDRSTGAATLVGSCGEDLSYSGLAWDSWRRKMYVSDVTLGGGWGLGTVNLATGAVTVVGGHVNSIDIGGLAFDSTNDVLYGADNSCDGLATIDRMTGVSTCIGPWLTTTNILGLAYNNDTDTLFGADPTNLYTIDRANGVATVVGAHGIGFGPWIGLEYDAESGFLFAAGSGDGNLYVLNQGIGTGILVGPTGLSRLNGLAATTAPLEPLIFADGFESGGTLAWSTTVP